MNPQEYEQLINELELEGWTNYLNSIDVQTVHEVSQEYGCEHCGSKHVFAVGLIKGRPQDHYRCFAVCNDCGYASEF